MAESQKYEQVLNDIIDERIEYGYSLNKSEQALQTITGQAKLKCKCMIGKM